MYDGTAYQNQGSALFVDSGTSHLVTPVYLPQGALIKKLVAFAFDNTTLSNITVYLYRDVQNSNTGQTMAGFATSNSPDVQKLMDDTVGYSTINNGQYSYHIQASIYGPSVSLYTVKIVYYY